MIEVLAAALVFGAGGDFAQLKQIAGSWKAKTLNVSYAVMSADTALVETYAVGSGHETLSVFHPAGPTVMVTHYCAQGNQPRLKLESAAASKWVFTYADATNLSSPAASHLVRLELELSADGRKLKRIETYEENGKREATTLELERVSAGSRP
jgi:hypothetical protein